MTQIANRWTPHWAIHPGEHLLECIEARGVSAEEFEQLAEIPAATVDAIIAGRRPITHDIAVRIDDALGIMPEFWFVLQSKWGQTSRRISPLMISVPSSTSPMP